MANLILDTGTAVSLIDPHELAHAACVNFFKDFEGKIFSTEAVLTEALYLLGDRFEHQKRCVEFFLKIVHLFPLSPKNLAQCLHLMEKYRDTPMDFADATLVALAEEIVCGDVLTLDRRGFEAYRWGRNRAFKIYPERS